MASSTDSEATSAIRFVLEAAGGKGAYHLPINQHLEILYALIDSFTLSCIERDMIAACRKNDCLAHQTCSLQEGDLRALRGIGIVASESTAVSGNA